LNTVTVHAISRLGVETTGVEVIPDCCLISIEASKANTNEKEKVNVKVVHHKVPWLLDVSSSLVRKLSASTGIDLTCLVTVRGPSAPAVLPSESLVDLERGDGAVQEDRDGVQAVIKELMIPDVLAYIAAHKLYGYHPEKSASIALAVGIVGGSASKPVSAGVTENKDCETTAVPQIPVGQDNGDSNREHQLENSHHTRDESKKDDVVDESGKKRSVLVEDMNCVKQPKHL
jgi:hypothetical protein